jgi:hypothetical protein
MLNVKCHYYLTLDKSENKFYTKSYETLQLSCGLSGFLARFFNSEKHN